MAGILGWSYASFTSLRITSLCLYFKILIMTPEHYLAIAGPFVNIVHFLPFCVCNCHRFAFQGEEVYFVKGALERILPNCDKYFYKGTSMPLSSKQSEAYIQEAKQLGRTGLRGMCEFVYL